MGIDLGHTVNSLAKVALRTKRAIDKNKGPNGQSKGSGDYEEFSTWLDRVLSSNDIEKAIAFNFNIYEDGENIWSLEFVGTSVFSATDSDWVCAEVFAARDYPYTITHSGPWQEILALFKKYVSKYLETGAHRETLKSKAGVGIGFVDGDLELLYQKERPKKSGKRKTLGTDFQKLVDTGDDEAIIAFLERCEPNACGGAPIRSALGFNLSPNVMKWLVEHGANVNFRNSYGATPLHHHARMQTGNIKYLLESGADINAADKMGKTPLCEAVEAFQIENVKDLVEAGADINVIFRGMSLIDRALKCTSNATIPACADIVEYLMGKGVKLTGEETKEVTRIGENFEFYYEKMNPEFRDELEEDLHRLYRLFDAPPVPKRKKQVFNEPIKVSTACWQEQHNELWNLLVLAQGSAETLQGEIIRISGKLSYEILDNGRMNWNKEYVKITYAMLDYLRQGTFDENDVNECASLLELIRKDKEDETAIERLSELAVKWVLQNPMPIPFNPVSLIDEVDKK